MKKGNKKGWYGMRRVRCKTCKKKVHSSAWDECMDCYEKKKLEGNNAHEPQKPRG